ncbi:unnamed protein product [Clavelina lepadiformis]|uniref:Uncharacterized protein n=1 Tax=Clavelina lepadiformis TaxID=159417 RepID=A0ABP0G4I4_CLALP
MKCVDSGNLEDLLMSKHVAEIPLVPRMRFVYEITDSFGSVSVDGVINTQYTPYYTAPEFLKNPLLKRTAEIHIYNLRMIGYEIITRHPVFHGVQFDLILQLTKDKGQKPEESYLRDLEASLESNPEDLNIFITLMSIVTPCWDFNPESHPDVRQGNKSKQMETSMSSIYDGLHNADYTFSTDKEKSKGDIYSKMTQAVMLF